MNKTLEDYINSLLEREEKERLRKFVEELTPMVLNANKGMETQKPKTLYYENSYKQPSIYTSPNTPIMQKSPDRLYEDKIVPAMQNTVQNTKDAIKSGIDWVKNETDILTNQKIDYSKPMIPHEKATDILIKTVGKVLYPTSSDMYTDGMTNFSRAKQNPNAEIINIDDVDERLKQKLKEFGTQSGERGVHYNSQSDTSKLFSNSPEVKDFFRQNKENIQNGTIREKKFNFDTNLSDTSKNTEKFDRFASVQHGTITDLGIDKQGRGTGKLIDRQDYEYRNIKDYKDIKNMINNYGYNMQEKNNLENYFSIIDILSDEKSNDEINNLLQKLMKYFIKLYK